MLRDEPAWRSWWALTAPGGSEGGRSSERCVSGGTALAAVPAPSMVLAVWAGLVWDRVGVAERQRVKWKKKRVLSLHSPPLRARAVLRKNTPPHPTMLPRPPTTPTWRPTT